jgi:hypothetical protein
MWLPTMGEAAPLRVPDGTSGAAAAPLAGAAAHRARGGAIGAATGLYVGAFVLAQIATAYIDADWGLLGHAAIVVVLLFILAAGVFRGGVGTAGAGTNPAATVFAVALLAPSVIQAITLSLPLADRPVAWRILATTGPGLVACLATLRATGLRFSDIGIRLGMNGRSLLAVAASVLAGIGLGVGVGRFGVPLLPVLPAESPLPAVALYAFAIVGAVVAQEVLLRGRVRGAAGPVLGTIPAVALSALLGAAIALGTGSAANVAFAAAWGVAAGVVVARTGSLAAVVVALAVAALVAGLGLPALVGLG